MAMVSSRLLFLLALNLFSPSFTPRTLCYFQLVQMIEVTLLLTVPTRQTSITSCLLSPLYLQMITVSTISPSAKTPIELTRLPFVEEILTQMFALVASIMLPLSSQISVPTGWKQLLGMIIVCCATQIAPS